MKLSGFKLLFLCMIFISTHSNLPVVFNQFFQLVNKRHGYKTRSASKRINSLPHVYKNQLWKIQY